MKKDNRNRHSTVFLTELWRAVAALFVVASGGVEVNAQQLRPSPRLVVNITIDRLRTDYLERFAPLYGQDGFRRLLQEGRVYQSVNYTFSPVDCASAVTCIATGASPHYNNIIAQQWLTRSNLKTAYCVYDKQYAASPVNIACSTIGDELKVATDGKALVFGVAETQDAAILSAGHAADGAYWMNNAGTLWTTSAYYSSASGQWVKAYNSQSSARKDASANEAVARLALACISDYAMGKDDTPDYIAVTLSASPGFGIGQPNNPESVYKALDAAIGTLLSGAEERAGKGNVLFVLSGTGYAEEPNIDYKKYKIPTGTFYINRTAQLLNMYLSAVYGGGTWVEAYYKNQIYLNRSLIDNYRVSYTEIVQRSKDFLSTTAGVSSVSDTPYDTAITGDLWIELKPGWKIINEETNESYQCRTAFIPFPVIFFGANIEAGYIDKEITPEHIAPTVAKAIRIRAPNACNAPPLF
ncbi:MAG: alkaline phosphatase family protein [Prevotella sp.]|nr:alkaline phosphatase family protein [Prevotella sp.]